MTYLANWKYEANMNTELFIDVASMLHQENPTIDGVALVSSDGRILQHQWKQAVDPDKIGAIGAAVLGLGKKAIEVLSKGEFLQVVLQSSFGMLAVYGASDQAVLIVSTVGTGNLGMLNLSCRQAAHLLGRKIADIQ